MKIRFPFATTVALAANVLVATSVPAQLFGLPSAENDVELGEKVAKLVESQIGLCGAAQTEAYIRQLGQRLAAESKDKRWNFQFQIVDQPEPNAFAIPGGGIYVSRGLLSLATSEDELAGVIGHEMAHVTERHSARHQRKGFLPSVLSIPGNIVGNVVSENLGDLINAPVNVMSSAWISKYSRGQEADSDRIGIRTAAQAGYDPAALALMLARLEADVAAQTGQERSFNIFDSHPMTESRVRDILRDAQRVKKTARPPIASNTAQFYQKLDGLWWGENPEAGVFRRNQFVQPALGFAITFPEGWKHQNSPQVVMAAHPKGEAVLQLKVVGPEADAEQVGRQFVARLRAKAGVEPATMRTVPFGAASAFVVTYQDRSGRSASYLHFAWVAMAGHTFQLIGLAQQIHQPTLRDAALSLRPLTPVERTAVTGKRLRIAEAKANERLEDFNARTGNTWQPSYTALVNGVQPDAVLREGQLLKIAREEKWSP